jgi:hypothetical protein
MSRLSRDIKLRRFETPQLQMHEAANFLGFAMQSSTLCCSKATSKPYFWFLLWNVAELSGSIAPTSRKRRLALDSLEPLFKPWRTLK